MVKFEANNKLLFINISISLVGLYSEVMEIIT